MSDPSLTDPVTDSATADEPSASTITFSLPVGIYAFKVRSGSAGERVSSGSALPAVKVDLAPGAQDAVVDFLAAPGTVNHYLTHRDDVVVARVAHAPALFMLVSLRQPDQDALELDVVRLDISDEASGPTLADFVQFTPDWAFVSEDADDEGRILPIEIAAQFPNGDRFDYVGGTACCLDDVQWIEAFAIQPTEPLAADLLEYGAIGEGQTTSEWRSAGAVCGIPGSNVPLHGFALRTKPDMETFFDCWYFGVFASGAVVGPLSDGALCASETQDDPLVRMDIRLVTRSIG